MKLKNSNLAVLARRRTCHKELRFAEQQIAFIPRPAEKGTSVAKVWRKAGLSEAHYYGSAQEVR
jgi:hypothetical protein